MNYLYYISPMLSAFCVLSMHELKPSSRRKYTELAIWGNLDMISAGLLSRCKLSICLVHNGNRKSRRNAPLPCTLEFSVGNVTQSHQSHVTHYSSQAFSRLSLHLMWVWARRNVLHIQLLEKHVDESGIDWQEIVFHLHAAKYLSGFVRERNSFHRLMGAEQSCCRETKLTCLYERRSSSLVVQTQTLCTVRF